MKKKRKTRTKKDEESHAPLSTQIQRDVPDESFHDHPPRKSKKGMPQPQVQAQSTKQRLKKKNVSPSKKKTHKRETSEENKQIPNEEEGPFPESREEEEELKQHTPTPLGSFCTPPPVGPPAKNLPFCTECLMMECVERPSNMISNFFERKKRMRDQIFSE